MPRKTLKRERSAKAPMRLLLKGRLEWFLASLNLTLFPEEGGGGRRGRRREGRRKELS